MNKFFFTLIIFTLATTAAFAQTQTKKTETVSSKAPTNGNLIYQLFSTQNIWTFIKLHTRNGKMWQVQYDVEGSNRGQTSLNLTSLVSKENEREADIRFA